MCWIKYKPLRFIDPGFANGRIRGQSCQSFQPLGEVVRSDEIIEVLLELGVIVIVVALDSGLLGGTVDAFDLTVSPRVFDLGETMSNVLAQELGSLHLACPLVTLCECPFTDPVYRNRQV